MAIQYRRVEQSSPMVHFGHQARGSIAKYAACPDREQFFYLVNAEEFPDIYATAFGIVGSALERLSSTETGAFDRFTYSEPAFRQRLGDLKGSPFEHRHDAPPGSLDTSQCRHVLRQYAPTALVDGCWLQYVSQAATCDRPVFAELFRLFVSKLDDANAETGNHALYRRLLDQAGIAMPATASREFAEHTQIRDAAFSLALFQLSISLFPRAFLPEIIGLTLAHYARISAVYAVMTADVLSRLNLPSRFFEAATVSGTDALRLTADLVVAYLLDLEETGGAEIVQTHWQRIWDGVLVQRALETKLFEGLTEIDPPTARARVIEIFRTKLPYARGHHRDTYLGDTRIESWLQTGDVPALVDALADSTYIDRQHPGQSPFLVDLLGFHGPMYKTFTEQEIGVIVDWIKDLPQRSKDGGYATSSDPVGTAANPHDPIRPSAVANSGPASSPSDADANIRGNRGLFHLLVNRDLYPDALPRAQRYVVDQLAHTRAALKRKRLAPALRPFSFTPQTLEDRVAAIYQHEVDAYKRFSPPPRFSRQEYLWLLVQASPIPLVDGCWLQNCFNLNPTPAAAGLRTIYIDEVGNGVPTRNHARIYRESLLNAGIALPQTTSRAFIEQPDLPDINFKLAAYLLAISQFPRRFLPEIIGLNLAIELSGLGNFYMRVVDEMGHWGLDSRFFALHLAIDNLASGHSAIAKQVVKAYLDDIRIRQGETEMQRHWQRIWTGYASLTIVPKYAWLAIAARFVLRFGPKRLRLFLTGLDPL